MSEVRNNAFGTIGFGVVTAVVFAISTGVFPPAFNYVFHQTETNYMPAVEPARVFHAREVAGGCEVSATAHKVRNCPWRKTIIHIGSRDEVDLVIERTPHRDPPKLRQSGYLQWDRIFVPLSCTGFKETFADSYHECRGPAGSLTRSRFWTNVDPVLGYGLQNNPLSQAD